MATLMIRELDDTVYERLQNRAAANGRSVEDEARQVLGDRVIDRAAWVAELRAAHEDMRAKYGVLPDSTPVIRQMREEE